MEKTRKFRKGMLVNMPTNLKNTDITCGASPTMYKMAGKRKIIERVYDSGRLSIAGYIWDSKDFKLSSPPKKIPIVHFDPKELVI